MRHLLLAALLFAMTVCGSDTKPEDQPITPAEIATSRALAATATLKGHTGWVYSVRFSPDGTRIASGSRDQTIRLWDASTGEQLDTLKGHTFDVTSVSFSPDGKRIASGSRD